jgi:hypothetical protein
MVNGSVLNHRQLIRGLVKKCKEKESGTLFFNLKDGRSARLVLNHGAICWIAFGDLRGTAAIEAIREIDAARMSFNTLLKLSIGKQDLPSTQEIVNQLKKPMNGQEVSDHVDVAVPTVTDVISMQGHGNGAYSEPDTDPDTGSNSHIEQAVDSLFSQDHVHVILERESLEYLGPMAKVLCADYMKSMPHHLKQAQIRQLIAAVAHDIDDEHKGMLFKERVKRSLNIL